MAKKRKKSKRLRTVIRIAVVVIIILGGVGGYSAWEMYKSIYQPNVVLKNNDSEYLYIHTGSGLDDVIKLLYENNYIIDRASFEWVAEKKNYRNHVKPGRYQIRDGMSNNDLIDLLRSGKQTPVRITFYNIREKEQIVTVASGFLEADSSTLTDMLNNDSFLAKYGFNRVNIIGMFLPNTYEFFWNTSSEQLFERMYSEYTTFWNDERRKKAEKTGLSPHQVSVLASIVEQETLMDDEKKTVAGVYINRLKRGMKLQADPTVIFAIGDFTIKRLLKKHLSYNSPFNTYLYAGLPPGPICSPSVSSIDGVLNYEKHDYLFFCAKDDFSGYHYFSKTLRQHNIYARKYQKALNRRRILK